MKYIISLGGSVILKDNFIDIDVVNNVIKTIHENKEKIIAVVVGGGSIAREYQRYISNDIDKDKVGIATTRLNAEFIRSLLNGYAYERVMSVPKYVETDKIIVASGYKPGQSTDAVAMELASLYKADAVINISNIDYVYDRDPAQSGARALKNLTYAEAVKIIGTEFNPGMNAPFDPVALKMAISSNTPIYITSHKNFSRFFSDFEGTLISGTNER